MTQATFSFTDADRLRLSGNRARVLTYLQQHGSATNVELSRPDVGGLGGVRRVWELTVMGYRISKAKEHGGTWRYTLEGVTR
jgi:hypothetical protein